VRSPRNGAAVAPRNVVSPVAPAAPLSPPTAAAVVAPHRQLGLSDDALLAQYELMLLARRVSERALALSMQGRIAIAIPCDGHEAAQIGSVLALRPQDVVHPFYRSTAAALARGMSPREIFLDLFARAEAPSSGGRQMPGHWARQDLRLMTPSSSVGTQIVTAVGTALASRVRRADEVSIAYFGDGASSKGDFHESLNFAAIWKLPVIFFCENNQYAISVPFEKQSAVASVADRAAGYGMPGVSVDGMDLLAVYAATREAHERARAGGGPTLIEARVYRFSLHTSHVGTENYREPAEITAARQRDPLLLMRRYLEEQRLLDDGQQRELQERVEQTIDQAYTSAETAPPPAAADACRHLFAETSPESRLVS
jgi:2-oxoisovalerate dehydrogenase E1 component subunit alpha